MSQNRLAGPGQELPFPQSLYPSTLIGAATTPTTSAVTLAPGQALPIPGGDWALTTGKYTFLQALDPVANVWFPFSSSVGSPEFLHSDGQNFRIANLTGCPIGAVITAAGNGYSQATCTVTANAGGSTWQPIVGGAVSTTVSITSAGSGYTVPPIVLISSPPAYSSIGAVQATGYAVLSGSTVSSVSITAQGAGYTTAPSIVLLPSPYDPNYASVTNATATTAIVGGVSTSGQITAVLCTNNGAPQASAPTLTVGGSYTTAATVAATMCWTATGASVAAGGAGYSTSTEVTSIGGRTASAPVWTNPIIETGILQPRPAIMSVALSGTTISSVATVYDGGLFSGAPTTMVLTNAVATTAATLSLTLGSAPDVSLLQPL